jgi:hypothetical protein
MNEETSDAEMNVGDTKADLEFRLFPNLERKEIAFPLACLLTNPLPRGAQFLCTVVRELKERNKE